VSSYLSYKLPSFLAAMVQLMEVAQSNYKAVIDCAHGGPSFMMHSGIPQASEYDDPSGLREKAEYMLREWVNAFSSLLQRLEVWTQNSWLFTKSSHVMSPASCLPMT